MMSPYGIAKKVSKFVNGSRVYGDLWQYKDATCKGYRVVSHNERGYSNVPEGICGYSTPAQAIERWRAQDE